MLEAQMSSGHSSEMLLLHQPGAFSADGLMLPPQKTGGLNLNYLMRKSTKQEQEHIGSIRRTDAVGHSEALSNKWLITLNK